MKSNNYKCPKCHRVFSTDLGYVHHDCFGAPHIPAEWKQISVEEVEKFDSVEKPEGYNQGKIECIDYIADKKMDAFEGNIVKYITRHKFKNGKEDIKKVKKYAEMMLERYEDLYGK